MKLIGNDIVDLSVAARESNWHRKGYLQKVFTPEEQGLILASTTPDVTLWLLWSMKEASYKIYSRKNDIRSFAPTSLQCYDIKLLPMHYTGKVAINGTTYLTQSTSDGRMLHTISAGTAAALMQTEVRLYLQEEVLGFDYHNTKPACISHHGAFLALVYLNPGFPQ